MVFVSRRTMWFAWCFILTALAVGAAASPTKRSPSAGFSNYTLTQPVLYHSRTKRQINSTQHEEGGHHPAVTMTIDIDGEQYVIDLDLRQNLVSPNFFRAYQKDNETVYYKRTKEELYSCEYSGAVRGVVRGVVSGAVRGWAALATCRGVRGVVHTGDHLVHLEPAQEETINSPHYVYHHSELNSEFATDYEEVVQTEGRAPRLKSLAKRNKRSTNDWRTTLRYVELVLVADNREDRARYIDERFRNIINIARRLFDPLNIELHIVGIISWNREDEMTVSSDVRKTLVNFKKYNLDWLNEDHYSYHDAAILITNNLFSDNKLGSAFSKGMCDEKKSVAVVDDCKTEGETAIVLAHEIGHLLGMKHDEVESCEDKGIMANSLPMAQRTSWSTCSIKALDNFIAEGRDTCLENNPTYIYTEPMNTFGEFLDRLYDYS